MNQKKDKTIFTIVIFGATGNLTSLKLFPAIYEIYENYGKDYTFRVLGFARRDWTDHTLQEVARNALTHKASPLLEDFLSNIHYISSPFSEDKGYLQLKEMVLSQQPTLYYFSVDPTSYFTILEKMREHDFAHFDQNKRIILEKPFGTNLSTAEHLDKELKEVFKERELYNIDHYLGKEMVQNLLNWRTANPSLHKKWNRESIKSVEIVLEELVDVEERPAFYDQTGALSDMVQNHAFQTLAMLTIDVEEVKTKGLEHAKASLLSSLTIKDWHKDVIRGQYEGYQKPILPENTQTETFVALRLHSSLPAWEGVPFFIKTGKALKHKKSSAMVSFHSPEGSQIEFPLNSLTTPMITSSPKPDFLKEKVSGTFLEKGEIMPAPRVLTDYASLIFECLLDKKEHFVSLTEIKASWQLIDTIREHFKEIPLESYEKGSEGPSALRHFLPSWKK